VSGILSVCHLGATPYREGLALQEALVRRRAAARKGVPGAAEATDWLLFPDHPPVLTMGRGGSEQSLRVSRESLAARGVELFEVARGGDLTWHGPGQLVGYPIVDLERRGRDLHRYLRDLEEVLILALERWGIPSRRVSGRTGVWAGDEKIASLGIAVRHWVGYHGFALNVAPDLGFFELIHPCGLRGIQMTSVAARLGASAPALDWARREVAELLAGRLGYDGIRWAPAEEVRNLAASIETSTAADTTAHHAA
jgi:lipoyl(octanoyl) transferase